jgi:hypothetical protein
VFFLPYNVQAAKSIDLVGYYTFPSNTVNFPELKSVMPLASSLLLVDWAIRILGLDLLCSVCLAFNVCIG